MKEISIEQKSTAQEYLALAKDYNKQKKYTEAAKACLKAIELQQDYAEAYYGLGFAYRYLGLYPEALQALNKAIELKPDFAKAYNNRGVVYERLEKWPEALQDASKAIELQPDFVAAYFNRGTIYCNLEKWQEALQALNKAIELQPDFTPAYELQIICCKKLIEQAQAKLNPLSSRKRKETDKNLEERVPKKVPIIPQVFVQPTRPTATKLPQSPNEKPKEETVLGIKIKQEPQEEPTVNRLK